MFKTIANPDGTISIVPIEQTNNLPFNVGGQLFNQFNNAGAVPNMTSFDPRSIQSIFPTNVQTGITASSAAIPFGTSTDRAQGFVEGSPSDASFLLKPLRYDKDNNFYMMDSTIDDQTSDEKEEKTGIAKLFDFLSNFIPGVGLLKRLGDVPGGIRSLNQRLRNTDFGQSRTGAEYFMKRRERKQAERAQEAMPDVYREARERGFTNERGGFSTNRADRAGTSIGSGQFSPKTSKGRSGY